MNERAKHDADAGTNTGKSDGGKTCAKAFVHCGILKPVKASQVPGSPEVPNTDLEPAGQDQGHAVSAEVDAPHGLKSASPARRPGTHRDLDSFTTLVYRTQRVVRAYRIRTSRSRQMM